MNRVIIAPDSFKECLSAVQVADAIENGFKRVFASADFFKVPMSDGGEGLVQTLVAACGGRIVNCTVTGPLGSRVSAFYGVIGDGSTGVVEMAAASGLPLIAPEERNPLFATTFGTGELIKRALDEGCHKIIVGLGGSATNDGGAGMAQALGSRLLTAGGQEINAGAAGLKDLATVDASGLDPRLKDVEIIVAGDVNNPLCGPAGASYVYGPQKGANKEMVVFLDEALHNYAVVLQKSLGVDILNLPGAGAAGGLGGGLVAFLDARLESGVDVVLDTVGLPTILENGADLVITAEGEINRQTIFGKVPVGVAKLAKKFNIPVLALTGSLSNGAEGVLKCGIDAYFSIIPGPITLEESIKHAEVYLADTAEQCARIFKLR